MAPPDPNSPDAGETLPPGAGADDTPVEEFTLPPNTSLLTLTILTVWGPQVVIVPYVRKPQGWGASEGMVWARSGREH